MIVISQVLPYPYQPLFKEGRVGTFYWIHTVMPPIKTEHDREKAIAEYRTYFNPDVVTWRPRASSDGIPKSSKLNNHQHDEWQQLIFRLDALVSTLMDGRFAKDVLATKLEDWQKREVLSSLSEIMCEDHRWSKAYVDISEKSTTLEEIVSQLVEHSIVDCQDLVSKIYELANQPKPTRMQELEFRFNSLERTGKGFDFWPDLGLRLILFAHFMDWIEYRTCATALISERTKQRAPLDDLQRKQILQKASEKAYFERIFEKERLAASSGPPVSRNRRRKGRKGRKNVGFNRRGRVGN